MGPVMRRHADIIQRQWRSLHIRQQTLLHKFRKQDGGQILRVQIQNVRVAANVLLDPGQGAVVIGGHVIIKIDALHNGRVLNPGKNVNRVGADVGHHSRVINGQKTGRDIRDAQGVQHSADLHPPKLADVAVRHEQIAIGGKDVGRWITRLAQQINQ